MPKYSTVPQQFPGSGYPKGLPIDVVDAGGKVVDRDEIIYFDTDTGVVISMVLDKKGYVVLVGVNKEVKLLVEVYKAPLSMRPARKPTIIL